LLQAALRGVADAVLADAAGYLVGDGDCCGGSTLGCGVVDAVLADAASYLSGDGDAGGNTTRERGALDVALAYSER